MTPYRENVREATTVIRLAGTRGARVTAFVAIALVAVLGIVAVVILGGWTEVSCERALGVPRCTAVDHSLYAREVRATIATHDVVAEDLGGDDNVHWTLRFGNERFDKGVDEAFAKRVDARTKHFFAEEKSPGFSESRIARSPFVFAGCAVLIIAVLAFFSPYGAIVIGDRASDRIGIAHARMLGRARTHWFNITAFDRAVINSAGTDGSEIALEKHGNESKPIFSGTDELCLEVVKAINSIRGGKV